jgi:hypothetical protein
MKLTKTQRDRLKQLVAYSLFNRFTTQETIDYIEKMLKVKLSVRYVQQARQWLKEDMQKEFMTYRQDNFAYTAEYLQRINEIKDLQRNTRILMNKTKTDNFRLKCISDLHRLTLSLANLYDLLPAISMYGSSMSQPSSSYHNQKIKKRE